MAKITSFRDLLVWQKSMETAETCYRLSKQFPRVDLWTLGLEIRRSAMSVPSNIAEGFGRRHTSEYIHHLLYAKGSNNELLTQIELARRVGVVPEEQSRDVVTAAEEVGRMLQGLVASLRQTRA